jgi:hypothetical protein
LLLNSSMCCAIPDRSFSVMDINSSRLE